MDLPTRNNLLKLRQSDEETGKEERLMKLCSISCMTYILKVPRSKTKEWFVNALSTTEPKMVSSTESPVAKRGRAPLPSYHMEPAGNHEGRDRTQAKITTGLVLQILGRFICIIAYTVGDV